jgi:hypothetical protein
LPLCQRLLLDDPEPQFHTTGAASTRLSCFRCPKCATPMILVERLSALTISTLTSRSPALDSS